MGDGGDIIHYTHIVLKWSSGKYRTTLETLERLREIRERIREIIRELENDDSRRETTANSDS